MNVLKTYRHVLPQRLLNQNMNYAQKLVGLDLVSVSLSRGATSFTLAGKIDGEYCRYDCSTMFEICFDDARIFKDDIIDHASTLKLWDCLEKTLEELSVSTDGRVCSLKFKDGPTVHIWSADKDHDNLFVVKRWQSDEWFTIG
jgi:hypothetical protein